MGNDKVKRFFLIGLALLALVFSSIACDKDDTVLNEDGKVLRDGAETFIELVSESETTPTPEPTPVPDPRLSKCKAHLDGGAGWMTSQACLDLGEVWLKEASWID